MMGRDSLGHLDVVEVRPLTGELGAKRQQGHEVARKGGLTALGNRSDDLSSGMSLSRHSLVGLREAGQPSYRGP